MTYPGALTDAASKARGFVPDAIQTLHRIRPIVTVFFTIGLVARPHGLCAEFARGGPRHDFLAM